jgi:hypothetical protein
MRFSIRQLFILTLVIALVIQAGMTGRKVTALQHWVDYHQDRLRRLEERASPGRFTNSVCETLLNDREYFSTIEYPSNIKIIYPSKAYLAAYERFQQRQLREAEE